jgi:hypothetical protein
MMAEASSFEIKKFVNTTNPTPACEIKNNKIKIRAAGLYPQGSLTRDIYGNFLPEGSLEYDYSRCHNYAFFINGAYARKGGHSIGKSHHTTMTLVPVTVGINALPGNFSWWHPYLGIGLGAAYAHFHNSDVYVREKRSYVGFASLFQVGMEFDVTQCFFFDLFLDYRFNWFGFNQNQWNTLIGGVDFGGGIGFSF